MDLHPCNLASACVVGFLRSVLLILPGCAFYMSENKTCVEFTWDLSNGFRCLHIDQDALIYNRLQPSGSQSRNPSMASVMAASMDSLWWAKMSQRAAHSKTPRDGNRGRCTKFACFPDPKCGSRKFLNQHWSPFADIDITKIIHGSISSFSYPWWNTTFCHNCVSMVDCPN